MVVATDRYVAEDACQRIRVTYEQLPVVVGIEAARDGDLLVHDDVPGNVAAHMLQEVGDVEAAMAAAPHTLDARPRHRAQRLHADGGQGRLRPLGPDDAASCGCTPPRRPRPACAPPSPPSSTCRSPRSSASPPTWAAASASRSCTRGPRRSSCPGPQGCSDAEVKWAEDRREHFISAAHERGQLQQVTVGFDDEGRVLGARRASSGTTTAPTRPTASSSRSSPRPSCSGPTSPGAYRCEFWSLYTNTVLVTPYRGAGRPQGVLRDGAHHGRHRRRARPRPRRGALAQLHPARARCPTTTACSSRTGGR